MASSDWTFWAWGGGNNQLKPDIIRYKGTIWYLNDARQLYALDEDVQGGESVITTFSAPVDSTTADGWSLKRSGQYLYVNIYTIRTGWNPHAVIYRYDTISDTSVKVYDPYDGTGFSHSYDTIAGYSFIINKVGLVVGGWIQDTSEWSGFRPGMICSYNGTNWFLGYLHDSSTLAQPELEEVDYYVWDRISDRKASTDLTYWTSWTYSPPTANTSYYGNKRLDEHPSNSDQWVVSDDHWLSYSNFKNDTNLTTLRRVNTGGGYFWTCATRGLAYFVPDTGWVLDYPNTPTSNQNIYWLVEGYTGSLFFFSSDWSATGTGRIYKRTTKPGGSASGGAGPHKLSIDRDSSAVYCVTYGVDSQTPDYWRVESDFSEVTLIDKGEVSGIYGGVHSAEAQGVYCYGQIFGDLVKRSWNRGTTFSGYALPSGVTIPIEASTLFTLRDNGLPDNVVITVTMSGQSIDWVYTYSGEWIYTSSGNFITESQVRRSTHTFIGALEPSANIVDYSDNSGASWTRRDTGLPTITITDIDFA